MNILVTAIIYAAVETSGLVVSPLEVIIEWPQCPIDCVGDFPLSPNRKFAVAAPEFWCS